MIRQPHPSPQARDCEQAPLWFIRHFTYTHRSFENHTVNTTTMAMPPEKLASLYRLAESLLLPVALKAAGPALMSFGVAPDPTLDGDGGGSPKKEAFSQQFSELLMNGFAQLAESQTTSGDKGTAAKTRKTSKAALEERISKLSLVSMEALDSQLIAEKIGRALFTTHEFALSCLSIRMEKALGRPFLLSNNPLHPQSLSGYFSECCSKATTNPVTSNAATNSWAKALEKSYAEWLTTFNDLLIQQRILPNLDQADVDKRYKHSREAEQKRAQDMRQKLITEVTGKSADGDDAALPQDMVKGLAAMLKQAGQDRPEIQSHIVSTQTGPALDTLEVLNKLNDIKHIAQVNEHTGYRDQATTDTLAELLKKMTDLANFALNDKTQSAISLLSMMFSKLNQEDNIAAPIKPLLNELQMPLLKRAIKDDSFFVDADNSAQQLVNEIAKVGTHWTPKQHASRDPLYKKLTAIVDGVSNAHEDDDNAFDDGLQNLNDYIEREERRASLLEERIIEAEEAKARSDTAKLQAQAAIAERCGQLTIPHQTRQFLDEHWANVLFFHINKDGGSESDELMQALDDLDQLVNASCGNSVDLRALFQSLNAQMTDIGLDRTNREERLKVLLAELKQQRILVQRAETKKQEASYTPHTTPTEAVASIEVPTATETAASAEPVADSANTPPTSAVDTTPDNEYSSAPEELVLDDDIDDSIEEETTPTPTFTPPAQDGIAFDFTPRASVPEPPPVKPLIAAFKRLLPAVPASTGDQNTGTRDEADTIVGTLAVNSWLHYQADADSLRQKVKLAAIIKHNDTFIFVNREGVKALVTTRSGVAQAIREKKLTLIEDSVFFDRALESVIMSLRD